MATARKLKSGSWRVRAYLGKDDSGKNIYKSFTAPTKSLAEKNAANYKPQENMTHGITFGSASLSFINNRKAVLSPSTINGYDIIRRQIKQHYPEFYNIKPFMIGKKELQDLINKVSESHSPKTVRNYYGFISAVIKYIELDLPSVTLPEKVRPKYNIPDNTVMKQVIECAKGTRLEVPILLAAFGPMRRGEICALTLDDIQDNVVHVNKDVVEGADKMLHTKDVPKTYASDRYIEFPQYVIDLIHKQGFVTEMTPRVLSEAFRYFLERNGIEHFRFHDLRHYGASALHAIGIPDAYIMQRGGWATDTVLKSVYRHTLDDEQKVLSDKANDHFNNLF